MLVSYLWLKELVDFDLPPEELAQYARKPCLIVPDPQDALREARRLAKKGELIVITGSIYLVGEYVDPLHRRQ